MSSGGCAGAISKKSKKKQNRQNKTRQEMVTDTEDGMRWGVGRRGRRKRRGAGSFGLRVVQMVIGGV